MKVQSIFLASISLTLAVPLTTHDDSHKEPVKRGIFDSISHFPFLASSSSAHGSSGSSSSSSSEHDEHDDEFDFHSHTIHHHPELGGHFDGFHHDDHGVAVSYQNQYFGHHGFDFDDEKSSFGDHFDGFNKYDTSLLEHSHLDASHDSFDDYKNYGGDLGSYSHNAGYLDISDDHKIDNLLDPHYPTHSSYDSY